jgi:CBS domain-containing protein
MRIQDRPEFRSKSQVYMLSPDDLVVTAVAAMSERNFGAVMIVDTDRKPVGIVTERDFMRRLLNNSLDPRTTRLSEIMTTDLKLAKADDDLLGWLQQMSNERFRHLPIVDDDGRVISMMSQGDFVSYTWPQLLNRLTEHARASFDLNPSIFAAIGVGILLVLLLIAAIIALT